MLLTIFTPTYNRGNMLQKIYDSIKKQNSNQIEWLIVDDGSSDNTEDIVLDFIAENIVNINYIKKENGGKHTAHNTAVDSAKGKFFTCLDSDDDLSDNAIAVLISQLEKCETCGIIAYKSDKSGKLLSNIFPNVDFVDSIISLKNDYRCVGEFVLIFPTVVLKENKFPVFSGERFMTESVLYDRLNLKMHLLPCVIQICEYQYSGLSNNCNAIMKKNPAGYCLYFMQQIDLQVGFKNRLITVGKYLTFTMFAKQNKTAYNGKYRLLVKSCYPISWLFKLYYKIFRDF